MSEKTETPARPQPDPVVRILARALFERDYKAGNAASTPEQTRAAWGEQRKDYMRAAKQFQARLVRQGLTMQATAEAAAETA